MNDGIEVHGLVKQYRTKSEIKAVNDLTFSVPEGQLFGLIGADGAGKTTTLRIISTVMEASDGDVYVSGIDIRKDPEKVRPLIGYMPQNFSLYPDLLNEAAREMLTVDGVPKRKKQRQIFWDALKRRSPWRMAVDFFRAWRSIA